MATASKRDVTLGVGIETAGVEGLQRLADEVRRLGAEGGPAAAQFDALADQIDRLSAQADATQGIRALSTEIETLETKQRQAAVATGEATAELREQIGVVATVRERQAQLASEVDAAKVAWREAKRALTEFKEETKGAARNTDEYRENLARLRDGVESKQRALEAAKRTLSQYGGEVAKAVNEESKLAAASERAARAQDAANKALGERRGALAETQRALVDAGAATTSLEAAEAEQLATRQQLNAELQEAVAATQASAHANEQLERAGREAERQQALLAATLKDTQQAAQAYASATDAAAASMNEDAQAVQARVAAARALLESNQRLTIEQRQLANATDAGRVALLAEAQALVAQQRAADASREATARLVRETQSAGAAINAAFGTTGVRSLNAIEQEALDTERAVSLLARQVQAGAISMRDFERASGAATVKLERLRAEAAQVQALPSAFERVNTVITGAINKFGALSAAVATVAVAARPAIDALIKLEQTRRILTTVTGSVDIANQQIDFLRRTASFAGGSFDDLSASYAKFAASALQSGLPLKTIDETFKSVAVAAGNLGLSSDQAKRALEALSQIASKGVANMEELRQQLGDALPGVLPLLAKELGITNGELFKIVETGQLTAFEAIPAIGNALKKLGTEGGKEVQGLAAEWNRFKSGLSETATLIGEGAVGSTLGFLTTVVAKIAGGTAVAVTGLTELFGVIIKGASGAAGALTGGAGLSGAWEAVNEQWLEADSRLDGLARRFGLISREAYLQAEAARDQQRATLGASESFAKLAARQVEVSAAAELNARTAEKYAQAQNTAVKAAETQAKAFVDQAAGQRLVLEAQTQYVTTLEKQAVAEERQTEIYRQQKVGLLENIRLKGRDVEEFKKQIAAIDEKLLKSEAETRKTRESTQAEREKILELELSARAYEDNSREVEILRRETEGAERAYDSMQRRFNRGKATTEDLRKATEDLVTAKAKLRDAVNDVADAIGREIKLSESQQKIAEAQLEIEEQVLKTKLAQAKAVGDDVAVRTLSSRLSEIEQRQLATKVDFTTQQIELEFEKLRVEEEGLRKQGLLTTAREQDIRTRRNLLTAQALQARASSEEVKQKGIEATAVQTATTATRDNASAKRENTSATKDWTDSGVEATERSKQLGAEVSRTSGHMREQTNRIKTLAETLLEYSDAALKMSAAERAQREDNTGKGPASLSDVKDRVRTPANQPTGSLSTLGTGGTPSDRTTPSIGTQYKPPDNSGDWEFNVEAWRRAGGVNAGFDNNAVQQFWQLTPAAAAKAAEKEKARFDEILSRGAPPTPAGWSVFGSADKGPVASLAFASAEMQAAWAKVAPKPVEKTVTIKLDLGFGRSANVPTTEAGAQDLMRLLEEAQRSQGGGP